MIPAGFIEWVEPIKARLWFPGTTRESDKRNYGGRGNRHAQDAWRNATGRKMPFKGSAGETWVVCHIYSWATKCPNHHSHTAGLVLVHPSYAWKTDQEKQTQLWLQEQAFIKFNYDPLGKFTGKTVQSSCRDAQCRAEIPHFAH